MSFSNDTDTAAAAERIEVEVPAGIQPARLDAYLAGVLSHLSRTRLADLIEHEYVHVDGQRSEPAHKLRGGERIEVEVPATAVVPLAPVPMVLRALFEDEHVAVIDKPAGLVVHPGAGTPEATLVHGLLFRYPELLRMAGDSDRPGIVHRLDRDTSGCIAIARTPEAQRNLIDQFTHRQVRKEYYALVAGVPAEARFSIETDIGRSVRDRKKMSVASAHGRAAITHVSVRDTFGTRASGLSVRIMTGRTHQIRVHLAHAGYPVIGDEVYGSAARELSIEAGAERQMLHAQKLTFAHPVTGKEITVLSPIPADIRGVAEVLKQMVSGR